MQNSGAWLVPLTDVRCKDATRVGGKAAQLHTLLDADFPVPPAWVVTCDAFNDHLPNADPHQPPEPPSLGDELLELLRRVAGELINDSSSYLAVRSSALGEDGVDHSFAGQHATYYYIEADSLAKAVTDCWLSLWSEPAMAYRAHVNQPPGVFGMAVIVQEMIQADRSGVCFTHDPTGRHPDYSLIEASWGLGAALVDGRVSPDRYWLDSAHALTEQRIGHKRLKVAEALKDPAGSRLEPVPVHQQSVALLSSAEAGNIARMAHRAREVFGVPQDMEWAYAKDQLHVLQSRPITALPDTVTRPVPGRWVIFKPILENLSEPLTPVTVDLFRRVLPPFGQFIHGRFYLDADLFARLLPFDLDSDALRNLLLLRGSRPELRLNWKRLPQTLGLLVAAYLTSGVSWHRTARVPLSRLADFEVRCRELLADDNVDPLATLRLLLLHTDPLAPVSHMAFQINVASGRYFILLGLLNTLLQRWAPDFDSNNLAVVTSGGADMLSWQMVEDVRSLADTAREDPELTRLLLTGPGHNLQRLISRLDAEHPFLLAFQGFMDHYGHRAIREVELMTPRWREDPGPVLQMVTNYLKMTPEDSSRLDPHGLRLACEDELHQALPKRWHRRVVDGLIRRIRRFVTLRENTRYYHTMAFAATRAKLLQLEERLLADGQLRCADDIFFLEWPEIAELNAGRLRWRDVEPRVLERRRTYRRLCELPPPESFNMNEVTRPPSDDALGRGDCASPGVAEGVARVILDPGIGVSLEPGEILVAPYTDPAWTPLFPAAAAVVVEVGSYLSHAGTVAREYAIPCLVDVAGITRRVRSGQRIRVNATEGWVEVMEATP